MESNWTKNSNPCWKVGLDWIETLPLSPLRPPPTQHDERVAWRSAGTSSGPVHETPVAHPDAPSTADIGGGSGAREQQMQLPAGPLQDHSALSMPPETPALSAAGSAILSSSIASNPVLPATQGQVTALPAASSLPAGVIAATESSAAAAMPTTSHVPAEHAAVAANNLGSVTASLQQSPASADPLASPQQPGAQLPSSDGARPPEALTSSIVDDRGNGQDSGAAEGGGPAAQVPPQS